MGPGDVATLTTRAAWLGAAGVLVAGGVAARVSELGTWGFSNDEAWVASSTRVAGASQWWLAIATTPIGWAALVKLASLASSTEAALRAIPFLFGGLTMAVALRLGTRVAGHRLGGVLALAVVAFDPFGVAYSKFLKQYTAEAFFCLLAFERIAAFAEHPGRRELRLTVLVLVTGFLFANSQLLVAPAILGALLVDAGLRRDGRLVRDVALALVAVGVCAGLFAWLVVWPRLPPATNAYWAAQTYVPIGLDAPAVAWTGVAWTLGRALGTTTAPLVMICLAAVCALRRPLIAGALALLLVELIGLSMLRVVVVNQPRLLLFVTTLLVALGAGSVGLGVVQAWRRPLVGVVATACLALAIGDFLGTHAWRDLGRAIAVEDAGPLVRRVERERRPEDTVLVHRSTGYIYAAYQAAPPVLVPSPFVAVGWVPQPPDARVVFVDDRDVDAKAHAAVGAGARVWFVGSRLRPSNERRIRDALARIAPATLEERRRNALMLLVQRTDRMQ